MGEDHVKDAEASIQQATDKFIRRIDNAVAAKEKDILKT